MSHNLEILSFQKMYGLLGFIREMKALTEIRARMVLKGAADTLSRYMSSIG